MSQNYTKNKQKIINDPVHGFIKIRSDLIFDLIEHPYFQRLRRIKQLGFTNYVYPGAVHTRFQHAFGAYYLMNIALDVLISKGIEITLEEREAACIAILLHDLGHCPFSHSLEHTIIQDISHEEISNLLMKQLNNEFNGKLSLAIEIFNNKYPKKFLHQLISGQLDTDRLDYLRRDSFFTGVTEGTVGSDRIIKMLNVVNDELVIESKGIYSIEKFLMARRVMYWQVYFHKTVITSEKLLINTFNKARELVQNNFDLFATPALKYFLYNNISREDFNGGNADETLKNFILLDDTDILTSAKEWLSCGNATLEQLSYNLLNRRLYRIEIQDTPFSEESVSTKKEKLKSVINVPEEDLKYFVLSGEISTNTYNSSTSDKIGILYNNGQVKDIAEASDIFDLAMLTRYAKKYYLCYHKSINS